MHVKELYLDTIQILSNLLSRLENHRKYVNLQFHLFDYSFIFATIYIRFPQSLFNP